MDEKKEFDFQPEKVGESESAQVEKDYNFDLFTPNRGKNIDSGRLDREVKARREAAKREKRAVRQKPTMEKAAPSELPTDIDTDIEFDNEQVFESEVEYNEPMLDAEPMSNIEPEVKPEPEMEPVFDAEPEMEPVFDAEPTSDASTKPESEKIQGIELDDDFQIGSMLANESKNDIVLETDVHMTTRIRRTSRPAAQRPARRKEGKVGFVEYFLAHKTKFITALVLAAIAIIGIIAVFSDMRMDIFGFTNNTVMMLLLIFAVVLMVLCSFTKERHRVIHAFLWVLVILIVAGSFAAFTLSGVCDFFGISRGRTISDFTIPEDGNWGTAKIAEELYEEGIINHPTLFRIYSKIKGNDGSYQWGNYELNSEMDYGTIMYNLKQGNHAVTVQVRIPEGANVDKIISLLEENGVCTRDQFITAMDEMEYKYSWINQIPENSVRYRFEGYLYPDTYNFYADEPSVNNAKRAIDKMLNGFDSRLPENWKELVKAVGERLGKNDMTLNDCMAIGSILELEASGNYNEMRNVASVFYNRLTWSEPKFLGSTPTYYYPDNRYNTNAGTMTVTNEDGTKKTYPAGSEGIPPGPQCSLTEGSILACLQPSDTSYTYFVTDKDMNFYYNKSYTAHLNTIAKLRREGKWA
ncbi:MAG: endolytic transglycosylase MltG [Clostridia bacterium]|nr:endolytic transglycosylase MltG [Clostridia bacterium]